MTLPLSERDKQICAMYRAGETRSTIAVALDLGYSRLGAILTELFEAGHIEKSAHSGRRGVVIERNPVEGAKAIDWLDAQDAGAQAGLKECRVHYRDVATPEPFCPVRATANAARVRAGLVGSSAGSSALLCAEAGS